jgi:hypothetical protein
MLGRLDGAIRTRVARARKRSECSPQQPQHTGARGSRPARTDSRRLRPTRFLSRTAGGSGSSGAPCLACTAILALLVLPSSLAAPVVLQDSGVFGSVRAPGICDAPIDPKCSSRSPTIEVHRVASETPVASVRPGTLGRFRVRLIPGRYMLTLRSWNGATIARRAVRVRPHEFTHVVLTVASRVR